MRLLLFFLVFFISTSAFAKPVEGTFTGPYLRLSAGILQFDHDKDQISQVSHGEDFEAAFGFQFGWNILDELAVELNCRYATNLTTGHTEHIVDPALNAKYIPFQFEIAKDKYLLPFATAGIDFRFAVLPSNPTANASGVNEFGYGPTVGLGVDFLFFKYFFFGLFAKYDLLFYNEATQNINNVSRVVYNGGFQPSFGAGLNLGVHY